MWAKQSLQSDEIDYSVWDKDKAMLHQMAAVSRSCTFVVDVYECKYTFASSNFADLLGYDKRKLETICRQGDYLESRIHPDDLSQMKSMQVELSRFIYSLPAEDRNNYKNIFTYRLLSSRQRYINVTSKHQVLETSNKGKAWLIMGVTDIASDQRPIGNIECMVQNLKTGEIFSPHYPPAVNPVLTYKETEILRLIKQGYLSKEIACKLGISIHTVNIHRQNILRRLGVQNSIEAINLAYSIGLIM